LECSKLEDVCPRLSKRRGQSKLPILVVCQHGHMVSAVSEVTHIDSQLGKYRLLALVGRGGMADLYLAMALGPSDFRKLVVVKCLRVISDDDEPLRRMFLDEGRLAARLNHPNVIQVYDVGETNGTHHIAMEYLDGQPLSRIMRALGPFDPRVAARIISDALSGLHYAHELRDFDGTPLNIVHRDLSPPNIFITYDGMVKLVDFGIAKTTLSSRDRTEVGTLKGRIAYMAPEQAGLEAIDRRADVFAMGVVLWELLTGKRLVEDKSDTAALRYMLLGVFPSASSVRSGVDSGLDRIVGRALEKDVDARYQTALQMREELEDYIARGGRPVRNEDLGRLVSDRFADYRRYRQGQIQACVAASEAEVASRLPVLSKRCEGGDWSADRSSSLLSAGGLFAASEARSGPRYRLRLLYDRKVLVVLGGAILVFGLLGGFLYARSKPPTSTMTPPRDLHSAVPAAAVSAASPGSPPSDPVVRTPQPAQPEAHADEDGPSATRTDAGGQSDRPASRSARTRNVRPRVVSVPTRVRPRASGDAASHSPSAVAQDSVEPAVSAPAARTEAKKRVPLILDHPQVELVE
jgi:serine/threonine protein kinase